MAGSPRDIIKTHFDGNAVFPYGTKCISMWPEGEKIAVKGRSLRIAIDVTFESESPLTLLRALVSPR